MISKYLLKDPYIEAIQFTDDDDLEDLKKLCPEGQIIYSLDKDTVFNVPTLKVLKKGDYLVKFISTGLYSVFSEKEFNKTYKKEKVNLVIPNFTKKIGIFYLDKEWATSIYNNIFINIPQDCIILPMVGENNCNLKGGGWIKTFYVNNPIRELFINEAIIQSTVNKEKRNDIKFCLLPGNHVQIID